MRIDRLNYELQNYSNTELLKKYKEEATRLNECIKLANTKEGIDKLFLIDEFRRIQEIVILYNSELLKRKIPGIKKYERKLV